MELAAMASAAVPGLSPTGVTGAPDDAADFTSAVLLDDAGKQWRVRSPRHPEASIRLETELLVLRTFTPGIRAELPFQVPSVAGTVRQGDLRTFVYNHVPGMALDLDSLVAEGGRVPTEIGRAMAGIHDLPQSMVDRADLPSYTADEFRQRKLNELDQAATTGRIPAALLRRWEHALEDVTLWKFNPCVVHGDLHEDNLLIADGHVTSVAGWTDLRIGDPADDFAWLIAVHEQAFADVVLEAYHEYRKEQVDPHLLRRAALAAEFALAQWLVRGLAAGDESMVSEAQDMLAELESDIRQHGGQQISVEEPPVPQRPAAPAAAAPDEAAASQAPAGPRVVLLGPADPPAPSSGTIQAVVPPKPAAAPQEPKVVRVNPAAVERLPDDPKVSPAAPAEPQVPAGAASPADSAAPPGDEAAAARKPAPEDASTGAIPVLPGAGTEAQRP